MTIDPSTLAKGVGEFSERRPDRKYEIQSKDFATVEQATPVPIVWGRPKPFAGVQFTPIFGFRSSPTYKELGK